MLLMKVRGGKACVTSCCIFVENLVRRRSFIYTALVFLMQHPVLFFSFTHATDKGEGLGISAYSSIHHKDRGNISCTSASQLPNATRSCHHPSLRSSRSSDLRAPKAPPSTLVLALVGPVNLHPKPPSKRGPGMEVGPRQDSELEGPKNSFHDIDLL